MIDDAVLERLLLDTADSLSVPDGGPARALDQRDRALAADESGPTLRRYARDRRFQLGAAAAAVIAVVAVAAALSAGGGGAKQQQSSTAAGQAPVIGAGASAGSTGGGGGSMSGGSPAPGYAASGTAGAEGSGSSGGAMSAGSNGVAVPAPSQSNPSEVPAAGVATKVIKTAQVSLDIPTHGLTATMSKLGSIAGGQGGYVASSGTNSAASGQLANGVATLRIPVANFTAALNQVEALGTPTSVTTSGQDVTSQYVDLQARLQALETARTQYEQILTQAKSIPDILSVEQQLSDLQTQIEQLQGQMNVLADQTSYSTITVNVSEGQATPPAAARPPSGVSKAWAHARHSFASGFESVLAASGGVAVFLIIVVIVLGIARLVWGQARRRMI